MFMPVGSGLIQGTGVIPGAWDISTATFNQSASISTQNSVPSGLYISPDGQNVYVMDAVDDDLHQYSLGTAWDISTISFVRTIDTTAQDASMFGVFFKPDGTKMFTSGYGSKQVYEYTLSTAWDISTATYQQAFSVSGQMGLNFGLSFKPDGTVMYVVGTSTSRVFEYSLSTAWDISTASYTTNTIDVTSQESNPRGVFPKPDGTKFYVTGLTTNDAVYEYTLSTPWDFSTATYTQLFDTATQDNIPQDVWFKEDGVKMFLLGNQNDAIYEYDLGT